MKSPTLTDISVGHRRRLATEKLDRFFASVPPDLKARIISLPGRIAAMNTRIALKLKVVLDAADEISAHAGQYAACARGCGHCCHVHVPIADFEAQFIADRIGARPVALQRSVPHHRMEYSAATPCPFLKESECSIYEARPLTCRMHLNFDVDAHWCLHENWNKPDAAIPRPDITPLMEAYHALAGRSRPLVADIRDFFPDGKRQK